MISSNTSGILNHFHVYPNLTSQQSGLPVGTIGITWRSYLSSSMITNNWIYPTTYENAKEAGTILYNTLGSQWVYCDGLARTNIEYKSDALRSVYGTKAPLLECLNHTYYQPYINGSISGSAQECPDEGKGTSTVRATAGYENTSGLYLSFKHVSSRATRGSECTANIEYGWNISKWYSGYYPEFGVVGSIEPTFGPLFDQMGYKLIYEVSGGDITNNEWEYKGNSKVIYNNVLYKCNTNNVTGVWDSSKWTEDTSIQIYRSNLIYNTNDKVIYDNKLYVGKGITGSWNSSKWTEDTSIQIYKSNLIYNTDDKVIHDNKLYICKGIVTGSWDSSKWTEDTSIQIYNPDSTYYYYVLLPENNHVNLKSYGNGKGMICYLSNFRVVDENDKLIGAFKYYSGNNTSSASDTKSGGTYSTIPATNVVTASCSGEMYYIVTEIVYIMKISSSSSAQTELSGLLKSSNYKPMFKTAYQEQMEKRNSSYVYTTPNIYYDKDGFVYDISFGNEYDNVNNYMVSSMPVDYFKSSDWCFNNLKIDQIIDNELISYTLYKYKDGELYISNNNVKKYIQMNLTNNDQEIAALFNSKEDHRFGYFIKIGKKQYYNIPVDMIINSTGVGSNDLTLLRFKNDEDQEYMPDDLLDYNTIVFGENELFTNVDLSKFDYSKLLNTDLKQFTYYQYIELDHLTENSLKIIYEIFGSDLTNIEIDNFTKDQEIDLVYTTGVRVTYCVYKNTTRVDCSAKSHTTNNVNYICIAVTINNITSKELNTFISSIEN